jgi:dihydrolipoamide dehydrogenase
MSKYDIAIIGAGPAGYVAAIKAAQMGAKVSLIESDEVGGICLNWGCIPTKTIIASINIFRSLAKVSDMGISLPGAPKIDYKKILERKNSVVASLVKGIGQLIKANNINLIRGKGSLTADRKIKVGNEIVEADNIVIATGSIWRQISGFERDSKLVVSSDDLINSGEIPSKLIILGGGVIGCEFASIYSALETDVTIVEALDNILAMEDQMTSRILARAFKKQGMTIKAKTTAEKVKKSSNSVAVTLSDGETIEADKVLVSVGRVPHIDGLGLEHVGVKTENGVVVTDEKMMTNVQGIYAIGDINGKYMLAHTASEEAIVAVENIMGRETSMNYDAVPRPIYTYPEVCGVGATEDQLKERNIKYKTGRFSYGALAKALCDNETEGQVSIHSEEGSGKVLGAALIGKNATEIAAEIALAVRLGLNVKDIYGTIHSHPTLTEVVREAAEDCEGKAIHKVYRTSR